MAPKETHRRKMALFHSSANDGLTLRKRGSP